MKQRIINPTDGIYPATPDYVHALEVSSPDRFLLVSGTMGLATNSSAPALLADQLRLVWANITRILTEADMTTDNIVRVTSYLGDRDYAEANQNARLEALGERRVPTTALVVRTLQDDWKIEIDVIAAA